MATMPAFANTIKNWFASLSAANTNRDGTGTIATLGTAGADGCTIKELTIKATGDAADCTVMTYLHDGTNYIPFREYDLGNPAAGSATVASGEWQLAVDWELEAGWTYRASITAAPTSGTVYVIANVADV